jgi:hypothetical protein
MFAIRRKPRLALKDSWAVLFYEIVENLLEPFFRGSFFDIHFNVGALWASLRLWRLRNVYSQTLEMPEKMRQDLLLDVVTSD